MRMLLGRSATLRSALVGAAALALLAPAGAYAADDAPNLNFGDKVLTDGDDTLSIDSPIDLTQGTDFGDGTDILQNNNVITIGAKSTSPVQVSWTSLETVKNTSTIDLRNGHVGDVLTISGTDTGSGKARLGLDVGSGGVDRLVIGGAADGGTAVVISGISAKDAVMTGDKGPVLIQAGDKSTKDAFHIENDEIGFVRYDLAFDATANTYRLEGIAGRRAYQALKISEGAASVWRQSADAWSAHVASVRDAGDGAQGAGVWGQAYGGWQSRDDTVTASDGRGVGTDYEQTTYGGQMGADLINGELGDGRVLIGLTGGYGDARMLFTGLRQDVKLHVANVGGYLAVSRSGYFLNALAKVDRQSIRARVDADGIATKLDGTSYGGQIEAGSRIDGDGLTFEKLLGVSYVSTRLDDMKIFSQRLDFGDASGFVAKAGLRGAAESDVLRGVLTSYGAVFVAHDFTIKDSLDFIGGDQTAHLSKDGGRTFGQLTLGMSYRSADAMTLFAEMNGDAGGGRKGGGLKLGARVGF